VNGIDRSLLSFLDVPVLVGDPEGFTVYVNPAFEERFEVSQQEACGTPLAQLFGGGGREAMLRAVAAVCSEGESMRFRMRERGVRFAAVASPIFVGHENVGVLVLLKDEVEGAERLMHLHRRLAESLEDAVKLVDEHVGRIEERSVVLEAVGRARQWCDAMRRELAGKGESPF
jgi:nitrogen-specific signal transduction histidine kinase